MKIFGIGLSKTATNSLCEALAVLGYELLHYPPQNIFDAVERCDGCADLPTCAHYKELDAKFPGSKFILTTRDRGKWLASAQKHFERRPGSTVSEWGALNRERVYGSRSPTVPDFLRTYDTYHKDVYAYFEGRDDLLVLNIADEDDDAAIWKQLCDFLEKDVPENTPFPHGNAAPEQTEQVDAVIPFLNTDEGDWSDLRYALRALESNFIDLGNVWLIGDKPDWVTGVNHVPRSVDYSEDDRRRNFNYCGSMWLAARNADISDNFLYLADDHFILTPRTAQNFRDTILVREDMAAYTQAERATADREWQRMIWETVDKLMRAGFGGWNYETHTPKLINRYQLMDMFAAFGYGDGSLIWQTAYFNMFPPPDGTQGFLSEETPLKAGFYGPATPDEVRQKADAAVYLNYNEFGFSPSVRGYLEARFPNKSRFEV